MKNNQIKEYIKAGLTIAVLYVFFYIVGIGCPIRFITGIPTAGCGMTRAWIRFIHFDIKGAFYYHPLFLFPMFYLLLFLFRNKIDNKHFKKYICIGIALFIIVYIIRLFNPDDTVININIQNGLIYKIFKFICSGGV